jgi:hypothetical protein
LEWKLKRSDTLQAAPRRRVPVHQHPEQEAFFILEGTPEFAVEQSGELAAFIDRMRTGSH